MTVRVFHATGLVVGDGPSVRDGAVVVSDQGEIVDVGRAEDLLPRHAGAPVSVVKGVIFPGLVNAHTHLELSSLAASAPPGLGFAGWAKAMLAERMRTPAEVAGRATQAAVDTLVRLATVAVGDVGNGLSAAPPLRAAGVVGSLFHEVFGSVREAALERVRGLEHDALSHAAAFEGGLRWAPSAHTLHTTHPDAVQAVVALARSHGARSSLHLAEHAAEREALEDGRGPMIDFLASMGVPVGARAWPGKGPVSFAAELGLLAPDVLLVHLADATNEELDRIAEAGSPVVLCPRSNQWIEGLVPRLPAMLARGLSPALGTDSLASSPSLDVLEEARELGLRFPELHADVRVRMATWNGAEALGISTIGRIRGGARPGLFAVTCEVPDSPAEALLDAWQRPRVRLDRAKEEST